MVRGHEPKPYLGKVLCAVFVLSLAGCDYWPPALQVQIEQLRSEIQTVTTEKTQLQSQVDELLEANQELQARFNELSRVNQEKSSLITNLQRQVDTLRTKTVKATGSHKRSAKPAAKLSSPKPAAKQPVKKKPASKR